jgi:hypothetical protein
MESYLKCCTVKPSHNKNPRYLNLYSVHSYLLPDKKKTAHYICHISISFHIVTDLLRELLGNASVNTVIMQQ